MNLGPSSQSSQSADQNSGSGSRGKCADSQSFGLVAYKPSRRYESCCVCNQLEAQRETTDLYDNHLHNYIPSCSQYICYEVKGPGVSSTQGWWSPMDSGCFIHAWICVNKKNIQKVQLGIWIHC